MTFERPKRFESQFPSLKLMRKISGCCFHSHVFLSAFICLGFFFHFSFIRKFAPIIRLLQRFFVIHFFVDLSVELPLFEMGKTGVPHPKNNYNLIPTYKNDISSKV